MYDLPYHKEKDPKKVEAFIKEYPFAFLTGVDKENRPIATQLPLFLEESNGKQVLRGHIMKGTDHHKAFLANTEVLIVFSGKHTYVSGTWYSKPYIPSTWNYMTVQIKGSIRFVDKDELKEILQLTSLHFEGQNTASTTVFKNLPIKFQEKAIEYIAGFEIEVKDIDSVFKLSQDRDAESYRNIIEKLKTQDHDAQVIAAEMEKRMASLFPDEV